MNTRNNVIIDINEVIKVNSHHKSFDRFMVTVIGSCNDIDFEAVCSIETDIDFYLDIFSENNIRFSKKEYLSIKRKIKKTFFDFLENNIPEEDFKTKDLYTKTMEKLQEKYLGKKVYFKIPFEQKDLANQYNLIFVYFDKVWYTYDKDENLTEIRKLFTEVDYE